MDAHATSITRSRIVTRLKWGALLAAAAALTAFVLAFLFVGWRVSAASKRLRHPDSLVRAAAVKELGEIGPPASLEVPTLLDMLRNDKSDDVVAAVVHSLWKIGPDTNAGVVLLRSQLKDPDATVRTHAAFVLGSHRPHWALEFLKLRRPWVKQAVAALSGATADEDRFVRWMAVIGIMRYAGPEAAEAVPALTRAVHDEAPAIRRHAIIALSRIGRAAHPAVPALAAEIRKPYPPTRPGEDNIEWFQEDMVKTQAAIALGMIGPPAIPELVGMLKDPNDHVRRAALMAFPGAGAEAVPQLAELLRDSKVGTRRSAAEAIGTFGAGAARAVPDLTSALSDPDAQVRGKAALSLGQAGPAAWPAVPIMAGLLKDDEVTLSVLLAFAELGPEAKEAVPALLAFVAEGSESADHSRRYTRGHAVIALLKIAPETQSSIPPHLIEQAREIEKSSEEFFKRSTANLGHDVNPMYR